MAAVARLISGGSAGDKEIAETPAAFREILAEGAQPERHCGIGKAHFVGMLFAEARSVEQRGIAYHAASQPCLRIEIMNFVPAHAPRNCRWRGCPRSECRTSKR